MTPQVHPPDGTPAALRSGRAKGSVNLRSLLLALVPFRPGRLVYSRQEHGERYIRGLPTRPPWWTNPPGAWAVGSPIERTMMLKMNCCFRPSLECEVTK